LNGFGNMAPSGTKINAGCEDGFNKLAGFQCGLCNRQRWLG